MQTTVDEIASGIHRLSTYTRTFRGGSTFNQFPIDADEPLLFHTGLRHLFPVVSTAMASVVSVDRLRWVSFGHWEADESGALNQWLDADITMSLDGFARGSAGERPTMLRQTSSMS